MITKVIFSPEFGGPRGIRNRAKALWLENCMRSQVLGFGLRVDALDILNGWIEEKETLKGGLRC